MGKSTSTLSNPTKAKKASNDGAKAKRKDTSSGQSKEEIVLNVMLKEYKFGKTKGLKHEELAKKCNTNKTSQWFIDTIKLLRDEKHLIEKATEVYVLTEAGADALGYKKEDLSKLATNEELHVHIKMQLNPKLKGSQIFDLLHQHGSKTRKELAELVGASDRSHAFSYGLQEVKALGYVGPVEGDGGKGKKLALTKSAYVTPPSLADDK